MWLKIPVVLINKSILHYFFLDFESAWSPWTSVRTCITLRMEWFSDLALDKYNPLNHFMIHSFKYHWRLVKSGSVPSYIKHLKSVWHIWVQHFTRKSVALSTASKLLPLLQFKDNGTVENEPNRTAKLIGHLACERDFSCFSSQNCPISMKSKSSKNLSHKLSVL